MPRYWWVNQNQTYKAEVGGGYMWSPKITKHSHFNMFYENMTFTQPGDLVFSFADRLIKTIGVISAPARSAQRPESLDNAGEARGEEGWLVTVDYDQLHLPLKPKNYMHKLAPLLPKKYSPIEANGDGKRVYLAEISTELADTLISLIVDETNRQQREIQNRTDISTTEKLQLVRSRVGQGQYRRNLMQVESGCRITGITDDRFLIASHIKPWSKSDDFEKLDGNNGLLLSPHIDHLFDRGYISFNNDGELILHPCLPSEIAETLALVPGTKTKKLRPNQTKYMKFHRNKVFGMRSS